jgi:hypothetical protein
MSDLEAGGNGSERKEKFEELTRSPFFTFSKPYLDFIGKERLFSLVYIVMAAINLVIPFVILYLVIDSGLFSFGAKYVFAFIFTWIVIIFAFWIGFQLWWDRRKKLNDLATSEFVATPIFSEILQTSGEWLGTVIGIIGAGGGLIVTIFIGNEARYYLPGILGFLQYGILTVIIGPVIGFFIIILSRFFAEQLRILAALANNTKEIAANIKNNAKGI